MIDKDTIIAKMFLKFGKQLFKEKSKKIFYTLTIENARFTLIKSLTRRTTIIIKLTV